MYLQFARHIVILAACVGDEITGDGRNVIIGQVDLAQNRQSVEVVLQLRYIVIGHLKNLQEWQRSLQNRKRQIFPVY